MYYVGVLRHYETLCLYYAFVFLFTTDAVAIKCYFDYLRSLKYTMTSCCHVWGIFFLLVFPRVCRCLSTTQPTSTCVLKLHMNMHFFHFAISILPFGLSSMMHLFHVKMRTKEADYILGSFTKSTWSEHHNRGSLSRKITNKTTDQERQKLLSIFSTWHTRLTLAIPSSVGRWWATGLFSH